MFGSLIGTGTADVDTSVSMTEEDQTYLCSLGSVYAHLLCKYLHLLWAHVPHEQVDVVKVQTLVGYTGSKDNSEEYWNCCLNQGLPAIRMNTRFQLIFWQKQGPNCFLDRNKVPNDIWIETRSQWLFGWEQGPNGYLDRNKALMAICMETRYQWLFGWKQGTNGYLEGTTSSLQTGFLFVSGKSQPW